MLTPLNNCFWLVKILGSNMAWFRSGGPGGMGDQCSDQRGLTCFWYCLDLCYLFRAIKLWPQQRYWIPTIHYVLVVWQLSRFWRSRHKSGNRVKLSLVLIQTHFTSCKGNDVFVRPCSPLEERRNMKLVGCSPVAWLHEVLGGSSMVNYFKEKVWSPSSFPLTPFLHTHLCSSTLLHCSTGDHHDTSFDILRVLEHHPALFSLVGK